MSMNEKNLHHHSQLLEWYELHRCTQLNTTSLIIPPYLSPQKAVWIENWRQDVNKTCLKLDNGSNEKKDSPDPSIKKFQQKGKNKLLKPPNGLTNQQQAITKSAEIIKTASHMPPLNVKAKSLTCKFSDISVLQKPATNSKPPDQERFLQWTEQKQLMHPQKKTRKSFIVFQENGSRTLQGTIKDLTGVAPSLRESTDDSRQLSDFKTGMVYHSSSNSLLNVISVDDYRILAHYEKTIDEEKGKVTPVKQIRQQVIQKQIPKLCEVKMSKQSTKLSTKDPAINSSFDALQKNSPHKTYISTSLPRWTASTTSNESPVFKRLNTNLKKHMKTLIHSKKSLPNTKSRLRPIERNYSSSSLQMCGVCIERPTEDQYQSI